MVDRMEQIIAELVADARAQFAIGQVSSVAAPKINVVTTGGAAFPVSRLATWTPVAGDVVLIAKTTAGWVAIGKIQT